MTLYRYIWEAAFPNFVFVIKPPVILTCTERNRAACVSPVHVFVFAFRLSMTARLSSRPPVSWTCTFALVQSFLF